MRNVTLLLLLLALLVAGPAARAATITIMVGDNYYSPLNATAKVGDVVKWQYVTGSTLTHPTDSDTKAWTTFIINAASPTYSLTMTTAGAYPYHCDYHGSPGLGMYGTLTVSAALPTLPAQALTAALLVYPNPASQVVNVLVDHAQAGDHNTVQVYDRLGRLVRTQEVSQAEVGQALPLDVADLPTGIYLYRLLVSDRVVASQRLVLLN